MAAVQHDWCCPDQRDAFRTLEQEILSYTAMILLQVAARAGHGGAFGIERRDATSPEGWVADDLPCYIIALEVSD